MLLMPSCASLTLAFLTCFHCAGASQLSEFPDEVIKRIFKHFSVKELGNAALVCRKWEKISRQDTLWEEHARKLEEAGGDFKNEPYHYTFIKDFPSWKEILKRNYASLKEPAPKETGTLSLHISDTLSFSDIQRRKKGHVNIMKILKSL